MARGCSVGLLSVREMAQRNGRWRWHWVGASEVTPGLGLILIKALSDSSQPYPGGGGEHMGCSSP